MKTRVIQTIATLLYFYTAGLLHAQIQFEEAYLFPPQYVADFEGVSSSSVAFADIDADGDQDVLITGSATFEFIARLYINDGLGSYALLQGTPFDGVSNSSVAFADVDGDGDQDVLITGWNAFELIAKLYTNDGLGAYTLLSGTPFEGVGLGSVAFADVDGDDDFDVLITGRNEYSQSTAKLYANDGIGGYSLVIGTPFDEVESGSIAFADVDADADIDVLITGYNNANLRIAKLYTNNGSGGYSLEIGTPFDGGSDGSVAFADIDGDTDLDLLITGLTTLNERTANLYTNDGNGGYVLASATPFEGVSGSSAVFADVDQDDDQDIMIIGFNGSSAIAQLYVNNGAGTYELATNMPFDGVEQGSIAFVDVDGDGDLDVLITGYNNTGQDTAKLYVNNGIEGYTLVIGTAFDGVQYSSIAFADVDGDEDEDLLITGLNGSGELIANLYSNDGTGSWTLVIETPFDGVQLGSIAFADVDGDDDQDLLITGQSVSNQLIAKLYTNDGIGGFTLVSGTPFEGVRFSSIAFADVDGDGDSDMLITGENGWWHRIAKLYTNDGTGGFTLASGTPFNGVGIGSIAFADVDGDDDPDVLITGTNSSGQRIAELYTNDGIGGYALVIGTPFDGVVLGAIALADVDGDDDQDVLITGGNSSNQRIAKLYTNDGMGGYSLVSGTPFDGVWVGSVAFADVDGDDDQDVLITGQNSLNLRIATLYANDGTGNFAPVDGTPFEGVYRSSIAFTDIDGDGDQDVMISGLNNALEPSTNLYRNTTPIACTIIAACSSYTLVLSQTGMATLNPESVDGGSKVTCGDSILSISQTEFDATLVGENTVMLTVTDENGNSDSCQAVVTVILPDPCRYFMSNYNTQGGSDVYEITLDEGASTADLGLLVSVPQRVNLAFDNNSNQLYLGRESNSVFQTINPDGGGALSLPIGVNVGLSGFMGSTFGPDGKLYAASGAAQGIYRFDPATFQGEYVSAGQIQGGDMDFTNDGELILVSRNPAKAFLVNENGANTILGAVPAGVSGLARRADGTFFLSVQGMDELIVGSSTEGDTGVRFQLQLNGAPFTPGNGDLASGCPVPEGAMIAIAYTNLPANAVEPRAVLSSQPNPTEGLSTVSFTTVEATRATLEVFDMSGRTVATLFNAEVEAGVEYRSDFNGAGLPNGVYVYRLTTENEVVVSKFMIAK